MATKGVKRTGAASPLALLVRLVATILFCVAFIAHNRQLHIAPLLLPAVGASFVFIFAAYVAVARGYL